MIDPLIDPPLIGLRGLKVMNTHESCILGHLLGAQGSLREVDVESAKSHLETALTVFRRMIAERRAR